MISPRRIRLAATLLGALAGCSEPGGGGFFPPETDAETSEVAPVEDLVESEAAPVDTVVDEPETSAPELPPETIEPDTTPLDTAPETVPDTADTVAETVDPAACSYHTDCYPERVCARWLTTDTLRCSDPCAGDADCAGGAICSKLPGSTQVGFCQAAPDGFVAGSPCALDGDCRSRLCAEGRCAELCLDESHCATPGMTCHASGDPGIGFIASTCTPDPPQTIGLGQVCSPDGFAYGSQYCSSGHCDLLSFQASVCSPICRAEADCAPAQECNLVLFADRENALAVPYDPAFTQKTHDAVSGCYSPIASGGTGFLPEGSGCTSRSECRSNKCLPLIPGTDQTFCTSFCTSDAQCPASMACKLEALTLSSEWLAADGHQAPGSWTFVRVCKFR